MGCCQSKEGEVVVVSDITKERVLQVYKYLEALCQHRNPVKRQIMEQPWVLWLDNLSKHPCIKYLRFQPAEERATSILKVRRPKITLAPEPPDSLQNWIKTGWQDPFKQVEVLGSLNIPSGDKTITLTFEADPQRPDQLEEWKKVRDLWAEAEQPTREAMRIYERVYDLYTTLQKESEKYRIILGDGILNWRKSTGGIHHPILLQPIELEFDPTIPEFSFREANASSELYSALFASLEDVDGSILADYRETIESKSYSPLDGEITDALLKRFVGELSVHGEYIEEGNIEGEMDSPRIFRRQCIFLQDRTGGFLIAVKSIIDHIAENKELPGALKSIVGVEQENLSEFSNGHIELKYVEPENVFFGKPANAEQIKVAELLENKWGVLVQGPPGTGKTHTIANLLGHLLANGKTVLVTSQTTKALRVLREKVAPELQPLCVSVLDHDSKSQEELKHSIESIVTTLSTINENSAEKKTNELFNRRKSILSRIATAQEELIEARSSEFQNIVISGKEYSPRDAIRTVLSGSGIHDWIPGTVESGVSLPLAPEEVRLLYRITHRLSNEDMSSLVIDTPSMEYLPSAEELVEWFKQEKQLLASDTATGEEHWLASVSEEKFCCSHLEELVESIRSACEEINGCPGWHLAVLQAGWKGKAYREIWETLVSAAESYVNSFTALRSLTYKYNPVFKEQVDYLKSLEILDEIIRHLENGGSFGLFNMLTHPSWSSFRKAVALEGKQPNSIDEFRFLRDYIGLQLEREKLVNSWNLCMSDHDGLLLTPDQNIEELLPQICSVIVRCLEWYASKWRIIEEKLRDHGLAWGDILANHPIVTSSSGELIRLRNAASGSLVDTLNARANYYRLKKIQDKIISLENYTKKYCGKSNTDVAQKLFNAICNRSNEEYIIAVSQLRTTLELKEQALLRQELLKKIAPLAPDWAEQIQLFQISDPDIPGDVQEAWLWKQLHQELLRRASFSLDKIQEELEVLKIELYSVTNQFISNKAWLHQRRRVKLNQQQALVGYLDVVKRIGRGTGKRVPLLLGEARKLMSECRSAVPVWIMPLTRVAETFNPVQTKFDVVIIDEASQCDLMGLIAIYLADQVVIVGDHEQVSPLSVAQNTTFVDNLIRQFLKGIPNAILYDGKASVYDLARQSFGGILRLTEHFRCVPEIIQFSNNLCYNFDLKPLRESNASKLKPATISFRVTGASRDGKTNEQEAINIVSLIVAACKMDAYKGKTMGVISLLGDEQALLIERYLRTQLSDEEYSNRRIICGNSAHFQGDERDVIFLSMVDSTDNPPLALRTDGADGMYKKRYNVAASRACDQMWVVHSLDTKTDLKPGDLRRELLEHAENPLRYDAVLENLSQLTESPFEREVLKHLLHKGYKVAPQWKVGHYRIDMVVSHGTHKVAIECDGDKFHTIDQLADDLGRQAVLERLGWRFIRIRGSQYYLEPEKTMKHVFDRLSELEVRPSTEDEVNNKASNDLLDVLIREAELVRSNLCLSTNNHTATLDEFSKVVKIMNAKKPTVKPNKKAPPPPNLATKSEAQPIPLFSPKDATPISMSKPKATTPSKETSQIKPGQLEFEIEDEKWVRDKGYKVWNRLAKWGEVSGQINPRDCIFARSIGKSIINETGIAAHQATKGRRLLEDAIQKGFPEKGTH